MSDLGFFCASNPLTLAAAAAESGAHLPLDADPSRLVRAAAPLERAGRDDVSVFHDGLDVGELAATRAGACLVAPHHLDSVPAGTVPLVTMQPGPAFAQLAAMLHPGSIRPASLVENRGIDPSARIYEGALLERGASVDPGAIVGPGAEIGSGSFIGAFAVIGAGVRIGRGSSVDAHACLAHALVGDRVTIGAGTRIGGAGSAGLAGGGLGGVRLGRVIVQNDVVIGANAVVERGALRDTVIGEGAVVEAHASVAGDAIVARGSRFPRRDER